MKILVRAMAIGLATIISSLALAQSFSLNSGPNRSAFRDTSNIGFDFGSSWGVHLDTNSSDPDLYVNDINMVTGSGWDSNLDIMTPVGGFDYNGGAGHYNFGTAISGEQHWDFNGAFRNSGAINAAVADGDYSFTLNILGGADNAATDTLASYDLGLTVLQKLDVDVSMAGNPSTIGQGQATELMMTVTNNMSGAHFLSTTWYVSAFEDGNGNLLEFDGFVGNWFGQSIAPGASHSDIHSDWHAKSDQALGLYTANSGVVGGLYDGDFYFLNTQNKAQVMVVPEPASLSVLGLGLLAFAKRKRK